MISGMLMRLPNLIIIVGDAKILNHQDLIIAENAICAYSGWIIIVHGLAIASVSKTIGSFSKQLCME
jgi:hypothetical protein